jgi:hypothetical protein
VLRNLLLPKKPVEDKHEEIIRWSPIEYPRLQPQTTKPNQSINHTKYSGKGGKIDQLTTTENLTTTISTDRKLGTAFM